MLTRARPNIGGLALAGSGVAVCIVWLLWLDFGGGVRGGGVRMQGKPLLNYLS